MYDKAKIPATAAKAIQAPSISGPSVKTIGRAPPKCGVISLRGSNP